MPKRHISDQVKVAAMRLVDNGKITLKDCVDNHLFSHTTAWRLRRDWLANGHSLPPKALYSNAGRPRHIGVDAQLALKNLLMAKSDRSLTELKLALAASGHGDYSQATISRQLARMGWTHKGQEKFASEQDGPERAAYRAIIGRYTPEQLVFFDESSVDWRATHRPRGWAPSGERVRRAYRLTRGPRYTVMPAISLDKGVFAIAIEDFTPKGEDLFYYFKDTLLPQCQSFPGNRSVIVMDNNSTHHVQTIQPLIEAYGCRVEYLPAYSPDYNPIEKVFGKMKSILKKEGQGGDLRWRIQRALSQVTIEDIKGYYRYSSYLGDEREG